MQRHNLQRKTKLKTSARVGRGSKRGKTSGRGTKGQKARAGHKIRPEIRDMLKKLPKLRGRGVNSLHAIGPKPVSVNLGELQTLDLSVISPRALKEQGVIKLIRGKIPAVKILAGGEFSKKVSVNGCEVSKGAREAIEKAGGAVR